MAKTRKQRVSSRKTRGTKYYQLELGYTIPEHLPSNTNKRALLTAAHRRARHLITRVASEIQPAKPKNQLISYLDMIDAAIDHRVGKRGKVRLSGTGFDFGTNVRDWTWNFKTAKARSNFAKKFSGKNKLPGVSYKLKRFAFKDYDYIASKSRKRK